MFKDIREKKGFSTKYVADKLNIKINTLYKYEEFYSMPSASILLKMQQIYKCTHEELLEAYKYARRIYDERKNKR